MAQVSQFSTAENFAKLQQALDKVDTAIQEAELAKSAGVPGADELLSTAQAGKAKIVQLMNTYFPTGTAQAS